MDSKSKWLKKKKRNDFKRRVHEHIQRNDFMTSLLNPQPMCDNHDDGETAAIILCNICGNLCTDCDRFLHLHRRTRSHQRQVCVSFIAPWC